MKDYERLTVKTEKGWRLIPPEEMCDGDDLVFGAINRLAELEDKIESGKLVELPAPLGSELWTIQYPTHKRGRETVTVLSVKRATVEKHEYPLSLSNVDMVGKYYFLTKEAVEAKLAELRGEK